MADPHEGLPPEIEAEVARVALEAHDLPHAAHHVAGLLAASPLHPEHLALFDSLAAQAGSELPELFPLEEGAWFGTVACRGRAMASLGQTDEALWLLCRVAAAMPGVPYLAWARGWPLPGADAIFGALRPLLEVAHADTWRLARHTVVDRALAAFPDHPQLAWLASVGARRSHDLIGAVQLARHSVHLEPSWMGFVVLANAHQARGEWPQTERAWRRALDLDPDDASVFLDWADALLERGDLDGARLRYEGALEREPGQPWADASVRYLDWRQAPTTAGWLALRGWARQHPDNPRARWAMDRATPWLGYLPPPTDALAHVLDRVEVPAKVRVTFLEGPSVLLALARRWPGLACTVEQVPDPDPRVPLVPPAVVLWRWQELRPEPALEPPPGEVASRVAELARRPFDAGAWLGRATGIAHALGPEAVPALLACTMHPGAAPEGIAAHRFVWRAQHAAAFVLAAYPGWEGPHREALWSMVAVRNDWQAIAAMAAAAARAESDDDVLEDALAMALTVLRSPPGNGAFATAWAAWYAVLRLDPGDALGLHEAAAAFLDQD